MKQTYLICLLLISSIISIGQTEITGKVISDDGYELPSATITEKGTSNTVITNLEGRFNITVSNADAILLVSFVGYLEEEVVLKGKTDIIVELDSDSQDLDQAIVIGYGNQKRSKISGAVSTIDSKEITSLPILRTEQALQGRSAGVQVTQNSGQPGSALSIRVRGTGSINNAEPLYVVDGIPSFGIDYLNPSDIESITVLKDAASAAIYGARGGNGVVLITTKSGNKNQPPQISYDSYFGIQEPWKKVSLLNAEQYAIIRNEGRVAAGLSPEEGLEDPSILGEGSDWQDAIFERAPITNHSFSFTRGSETSTTALGASYFLQDGIVGGEKSRFERTTIRLNTTQTAGKRFRLGQNINFTHLKRNALPENNEFSSPVVRALNMDPTTPITRPDGSYSYSNYIDSDIANPVNAIEQTFDTFTSNRLVGTAFAEYDFFKNLTFRSSYTFDLTLGSQDIFFPTFDLGIGENDPNRPSYEWREINSITNVENKWSNWQWENVATYTKDFESGNKLTVIGGYSALYNKYSNLAGSRDSLATNLPGQAFLDNSLDFAEQAPRASGGISESSFLSTFLRANYEIGNEFSFAATVRRDGSSRFGINNRYGIFPSFSGAWNLTEKEFVKNIDQIEFLKVRASWGQNGNADGIGNYDYTALVTNGLNYTFGSDQQQVNGAGPIFTSNPDLRWETVQQTNIGLDADLYKGKLNFVFDYFIKDTKDMLARVPIPGVVGLEPSATNVASARNSGVELYLNYRNKDRKDFTYSVGGNISFIKNEVTGLGEGGQPISTGNVFGNGDFVAYTEIGMPIAYFYGYETDGIFQTDEAAIANTAQPEAAAGDVIFVDQNDDGEINDQDKVMIGNPHPGFTYGFTVDLTYKNFDLNLFINGSQGNDLYAGYFRYDLNQVNLPISFLERWTGEGSTNENPRVSNSDPNGNNRVSDRFVEDGSFTRIKNIQLGYTLPNTVAQKIKLRKVRVYIAAQNLFTFTKYTGLDPEIGSRGTLEIGIDRGFYPAARMFMAGLNVNF